MSSLSEIFDFEKFNLKDIGKKLFRSPERLLVGAVDPWSTKVWNKTGMGKDWEPAVDQWGGAYGGSTTTLGDTGEGVYGRAAEAGVPTQKGAAMHDVAHVIAAMYAGNYGASKIPGGFGAGGMGGGSQPEQPEPQKKPPLMAAPPQVSVLPREKMLANRLLRLG